MKVQQQITLPTGRLATVSEVTNRAVTLVYAEGGDVTLRREVLRQMLNDGTAKENGIGTAATETQSLAPRLQLLGKRGYK